MIEEREAEDGRAVSFVIKFDNGKTSIRHKSHSRREYALCPGLRQSATQTARLVP